MCFFAELCALNQTRSDVLNETGLIRVVSFSLFLCLAGENRGKFLSHSCHQLLGFYRVLRIIFLCPAEQHFGSSLFFPFMCLTQHVLLQLAEVKCEVNTVKDTTLMSIFLPFSFSVHSRLQIYFKKTHKQNPYFFFFSLLYGFFLFLTLNSVLVLLIKQIRAMSL